MRLRLLVETRAFVRIERAIAARQEIVDLGIAVAHDVG